MAVRKAVVGLEPAISGPAGVLGGSSGTAWKVAVSCCVSGEAEQVGQACRVEELPVRSSL
jgi:hypothetical protein